MITNKFDDLLKAMNIHQVIVLNLKHRSDRLSFMKLKLSKVNISQYRIFEAIDGYKKENLDIYEKYCNANKDKRKIIQSPGAMGISMSYKKMFEECLNDPNFTDMDKIFVMEDDINFHKNFNQEFLKYIGLIKNSDIVYIGANQSRWIPFTTKTYYKVFTEKWHSVYGFFGLILNRKTMRLIYDELNREPESYINTVDYLTWLLIVKHELNANVIFPNLVISDVSDSDNMGPRDMIDFAHQRKWDLSLYETVFQNSKFYQYYRDVYSLNIGLEDICEPWFDDSYRKTVIGKNTEFVFIIPSFNNQDWIEKNLSSIMKQQYPFWRVIYIDDASTDKTEPMFNTMIKKSKFSKKFEYLRNQKNMKQAYSRYRGYNHRTCMQHEVAILLDGDDWLYDEQVLSHLNHLYQNHDIVMTWGQFYYHGKNDNKLSGFGTFPEDIANYRTYPRMVCQHLRTAKIELLQAIPKSYLQDHHNKWYECCTDVAENMCLLELSGGKYLNSQKPLCVYNTINSVKYPNSYYNTEQYHDKKRVRTTIMNKIKNEQPLEKKL